MAIVPATRVEATGDGITSLFGFSFPYESQDDVYVTVGDVITPFTFSTPSIVSILPAPANLSNIVIYRETPALTMHYIFTSGVPFLTKFADTNWRQLLYTFQEFVNTTLLNSFNLTKTLRTPDAINVLPNAVTRADKIVGFDASGQPVVLSYLSSSIPGLDARLTVVESSVNVLNAGRITTIPTFAGLSIVPATVGQCVFVRCHTSGSLGGGQFLATAGTASPDNGTQIDSATAGVYWQRMHLTEYNVEHFGLLPDGTDQTSKFTTMLTALGSGFFGTIYVPQNIVFNFNTVSLALPKRAILRDESGINAWNSGGFRQRVVGWTDGSDSTAVSDLAFRVSSGHNATIILDNRQTASSSSGTKGISMIMWCRGQFSKGQPGYRDLARWEWSENPGTGKWFYVLRKGVNWANRDYELWASGTVFAAGASCRSSAGIYTTVAGGTSGSTEPVHTVGTVTDGGVLWLKVSNRLDDSLFMVNELGEVGINNSPTSSVVLYAKANPDASGTAALYVECSNASKIASIRLRPTDAAGAVVAMPYHQAQDGVGVRLTTSTTSLTGYTASDSQMLQLGTFSFKEGLATNNSATPSVDNIGLLRLANTGVTSITGLTTTVTARTVDLIAENGNTTLVHNAGTFVLKGGINAPLVSGNIITMMKYPNSGAWFEKSRNF